MSQSSTPFGTLERTLAWRYLRARREHGGASLISVISLIGIFFAVAALIIVMSIMSGFRSTLLDAFTGGQPHIAVDVSQMNTVDADALVTQLSDIDGIESIYPIIEEYVLISANGRRTGAAVRGVTTENLAEMSFLKDGGAFALQNGFGEGKNGGDAIMMGLYLARGAERGLGVSYGDKVNIVTSRQNTSPFGGAPRNKDYVVADIFETGSVELDYLYAFMPIEQAQLLFNMKDKYSQLDVRITDPDKTELVMQRINEATGYGVAMKDWKSQREAYLNALQVERTMVRLLIWIITGIATLNIIVGVVMLVKNKTRDIAILRTMGLGKSAIQRVFMMVGTCLGTAGALLGVLVGVLVVWNIGPIQDLINGLSGANVFDAETYKIYRLPAILSWKEVFMSAGFAIVASILVSIIPAWWASRLDPVEALRFE